MTIRLAVQWDLMAAVLPATRHLALVAKDSAGAGAVKPYRLVLCAAPAP